MAAQRRWSDLSERTRRLIIVAAVADGILKGAALLDIKRRPANQIRGPKWLWAPVVAVVNSAGLVPISYFVFGRRRPPLRPGLLARTRPMPCSQRARRSVSRGGSEDSFIPEPVRRCRRVAVRSATGRDWERPGPAEERGG